MKLSELIGASNSASESIELVYSGNSSQDEYTRISAVDWDEDELYFIPEGWVERFDDSVSVTNLQDIIKIANTNSKLKPFIIRVRTSNKWAAEGTVISSNSLVLKIKYLNENLFCLIHEDEASTLTFKGARNRKFIQSE